MADISRTFLAIDIETTGCRINGKHYNDTASVWEGDVCFAIGLAVAKGGEVLERRSYVVKLFNRGNLQELWQNHGFEMRCFTEFWSKHEDKFWQLQQRATDHIANASASSSNLALAHWLQNTLVELEAKYGQMQTVFDTVAYDASWVCFLLCQIGAMPIQYTRAGRYNGGYELDSYIVGLLGLDVAVYNWNRDVQPFYDYLGQFIKVEHTHDPADDAELIARRFVMAKAKLGDYLAIVAAKQ